MYNHSKLVETIFENKHKFFCRVWLIYESKQANAETKYSGVTAFVILGEHRFDRLGVRGNAPWYNTRVICIKLGL